MTIGAVFRNGATSVQIDSTYVNHALLTSGEFNLAPNNDTTITVTATAPIIAFTGTGAVALLGVNKSGNTWSFDIFAEHIAAAGMYYIFDVVQEGSQMFDTTVGLRLRNPDTGAVTYDSRLKYLRVVSTQTIDMRGLLPANPQTQALPQADLAVVLANSGVWIDIDRRHGIDPVTGDPIETDVYTPYVAAANVNGATLTFSTADTRFTTTNEGNQDLNYPCTLMLIDISNF